MEPEVKKFFILNGLVLIGVVLYMFKKRPKSKIKMATYASKKDQLPQVDGAKNQPKELNVIFNYNGHDWDAYEVFGVPAGSSWESVSKAYENTIAGKDEASRGFFNCAYKAIKKKQGI